jgi:5-(carboxyamino)imidazole ribonucleotide mutase
MSTFLDELNEQATEKGRRLRAKVAAAEEGFGFGGGAR